MKKESFNLLALVILYVVVGGLALTVTFARAAPEKAPQALVGAPSMVSYQGQVTVDNTLYHGDGYFKFAIVNETGSASYWSNDGVSRDGKAPAFSVPLSVTRGLFNVLLGDPALSNMTQPLDASVFGDPDRYLRVWFSADDDTFLQLTPDQRIAAVPYALQTDNADTLDDRHADSFANTNHLHTPWNIVPQGENSSLDADMLDGQHASDLTLSLPPGAMVLGSTENETDFILAGLSYTGLTAETDGWFVREDMPTGRWGLTAIGVDGIIYAIGGWSPSAGYLATNEAYDPVTDSWSVKAPMPTARRYMATTVVDGLIYAIGGWSAANSYEDANEVYDPLTNSWSVKSPMPLGRNALATVTMNGVIYAIGGYSAVTSYERTNQIYDPSTDSWTTEEPMPTGRYSLGAVVVDKEIYVIGGRSAGDYYETATEVFDPKLDEWESRLAMPTGRSDLAVVTVNNMIYAIGGRSADTYYEMANEAYDPGANFWSTKSAMPTGRNGLAAAVMDGVIYVIGGYSFTEGYETANDTYFPALYIYRKGD